MSAVYYRDQMAEQLRNMAAAHNADLPLHVLSGTNTDRQVAWLLAAGRVGRLGVWPG